MVRGRSRSLPCLGLLVVLLFGLSTTSLRAGRFVLFDRSWGDVIVVTDMTQEGRAIARPTPESPAYYLGTSLGCRLGSIPGDRLPDPAELGRFATRMLARQGYLPAQPGARDPSLYIVLQWGSLAPDSGDLLWFLGYDAWQDIGAQSTIGMLGPEVFRRNMRSRETQTVLDYASGAIYGVIITAFEYKSASTPRPVILWQTRIGLPSNGKTMAEALPVMVQLGASQVGRETTKPILRDADDRYITRLGELEVLGFEEEPGETAPKSPPANE